MSNEAPTDALRLVPIGPFCGYEQSRFREAIGLAAFRIVRSLDKKHDHLSGGFRDHDDLEAGDAILSAIAEQLPAPASPLPEGGGDMDWQSVAMWMGFSASVIKSGEPWSDQCQQHYDEAKAAFARLAAPTGAK